MREAYFKAMLIIASCENATHLKGARNYIEQFIRVMSKRRGNFYETSEEVWEAYYSLDDLHRKKEKQLA